MNARLTALAAILTVGIAAPVAAQASSPRSGCTPGAALLSHSFGVAASSDVRNVKAGNDWLSSVVVERKVGSATSPGAGVQVELALRFADGHLASTTGRTDSLGRVSLDLTVPAKAAAGFASATWTAVERVDTPCGPQVDSYGDYTIAKAVRIVR